MDPSPLLVTVVALGLLVVFAIGLLLLILRLRVVIPSGKALLLRRAGAGPRLVREGAVLTPLVASAELVDLGTTSLTIARRGREALRCKDKIRTSVTLEVQLSVSPQAEDAARAAERVGAAHVADEARLRALFESRFEVALRSALGQLRFEEAERERELLGETIAQIVGADLDGFRLEGVFVRELEQVPVELHDPNDLLDAEGIRAIVERTAEATVRANELRRAMEAQIAAQNVEAAAALAQIERRRAAQAEEHAAAIEAEKERQRRGW